MVAVEENLSPRILGGNGIAAGAVNYPGAAAHTGSCRSGFRGVEHSDFLGSTPIPLNIYYDANWQAVETRTNGIAASDVTNQMVWSAAYINAAILQDTYSAGVVQPNSRLYFLQDANWDTTAVVGFNSTTGTWGVTQRYVYSPYGSITVLNADWITPATGVQPVVINLYQGMTLDAVTGLYYERFRNYSPGLGTWISQDPLSYVNGANTYQFVMGNPAEMVDPWGLETNISVGESAYLGFGGGWKASFTPKAVKGGTDFKVTVNLHAGIGLGGDVEIFGHKFSLETTGPSLEYVIKLKAFVPCGKKNWSTSIADSQRVNDTFSGSVSAVLGVEASIGIYGELQEKFTLSGTHPLVLSSVIQFVGKIHSEITFIIGPIRDTPGYLKIDKRGKFAILSGKLVLDH